MHAYPDPRLAALERLRTELPALRPGVTAGTEPPDPERDDTPVPPYVYIAQDGAFQALGIAETATIRVVCYGTSDADGYALAQLARAVLVTHPGDSIVRSVGYLTGPYPTTDPDTGAPISAFTVALRMKPAVITP